MKRAKAAIAGSGATPMYFRGESAPQTIYELIGKAVMAAVADAGLTLDEVDGLAFFAFGFDTGLVIENLGLKNVTFAAFFFGNFDCMAAAQRLHLSHCRRERI